MPRRTVTIAPTLDKAIRSLQAKLLKERDRDVTYTEALNFVLLNGFLRPWHTGKRIAFWKEGNPEVSWEEVVNMVDKYESEKLYFEGWLDMAPTAPEPNE